MRGSAVGGGADFRLSSESPDLGSSLAQANQAFHPSWFGELVHRPTTAIHCMAKWAFKLPSQHPVEVDCVAHTAEGVTRADL